MSVARVVGAGLLSILLMAELGLASPKSDKVFHALTTDAKGVETEVQNLLFYWEEKISETSFVPHEMKEMPVKRGTATIKIKFDLIKTVDIKPSVDGAVPALSITLNDGKTGDFMLAIPGSFKGQSDFGDVEVPVADLKRVMFK
jgi:hypothetical protein